MKGIFRLIERGNCLVLEKVEGFTLYMIELKKEVNRLKKDNIKQHDESLSLKNKIETFKI
jgi:hypothetical protein